AILKALSDAGLYSAADAANFPGGALAGVFPGGVNENSKCPQLPQPFYSAPGSAFGGPPGHPRGPPLPRTCNPQASKPLGEGYQVVYGRIYGENGRGRAFDDDGEDDDFLRHTAIQVSRDILVAAPIWHDWAKPIVFQWNADGSEFAEFNFGGNGVS